MTNYFKRYKWAFYVILFVAFIAVWLGANAVLAFTGTGGLISEKLIGNTGTSDSHLVIQSATNNTSIDIGQAPVPLSVQSTNGTTVMRGSITDMNDFPIAYVYFEWVDLNGSHTTAQQTCTATGNFTSDVSGLFSGSVEYRLVVEADGTNYGDWVTMHFGGMSAQDILWYIIPIVVAGGIILIAARLNAPITLILALIIAYAVIVLILRAVIF